MAVTVICSSEPSSVQLSTLCDMDRHSQENQKLISHKAPLNNSHTPAFEQKAVYRMAKAEEQKSSLIRAPTRWSPQPERFPGSRFCQLVPCVLLAQGNEPRKGAPRGPGSEKGPALVAGQTRLTEGCTAEAKLGQIAFSPYFLLCLF